MGSPCLFTRQQALKMGYFTGCTLRRLEIVFIFPRLVLQILFQLQFGLSYQCEIYHRHK